jgi:hypothetical protein
VRQDVAEALQRYDAVSQRLGEEFKSELRRVIAVAAAKPGSFHLLKPGFHRANLKRFSLPLHLPRVAGRHSSDAGATSPTPSRLRHGAGMRTRFRRRRFVLSTIPFVTTKSSVSVRGRARRMGEGRAMGQEQGLECRPSTVIVAPFTKMSCPS